MDQNSCYILSCFLVGLAIITAASLIPRFLIFKKAGEKWWKALVPFYSDFTLYKLAWNEKFYFIQLGLLILMCVAQFFAGMNTVNSGDAMKLSPLYCVLLVLLSVAYIVFISLLNVNLSKSFGENWYFAMIGLVVSYPIFELIIALKKNDYIGPRGVAKTA